MSNLKSILVFEKHSPSLIIFIAPCLRGLAASSNYSFLSSFPSSPFSACRNSRREPSLGALVQSKNNLWYISLYLVDAVATSKMLKFTGPSGLPAKPEDAITISKALSQKAFAAGKPGLPCLLLSIFNKCHISMTILLTATQIQYFSSL